MGGSSPQLSDHDANNSDTLVVDRRDPTSSHSGNSASLDTANAGNSPLAAGAVPPRRRERKSISVRQLMFILQITGVFSAF